MSKNIFCVDKRTKFFKNLVSSLDIHSDSLENLIHQIDRSRMSAEELTAKIKSTIKIGATIPIEDEQGFEDSLLDWETYTDEGFVYLDDEVDSNLEEELKALFGKEQELL